MEERIKNALDEVESIRFKMHGLTVELYTLAGEALISGVGVNYDDCDHAVYNAKKILELLTSMEHDLSRVKDRIGDEVKENG